MFPFFNKKNLRPFCLLALLLVVAFYDIVFLNKTLKVTTANSQALPNGPFGQENNKPKFIPVHGTDSPVQEEPLYEFIRQNLRRGILPLWNPHQGCGYPLLAMIEVGVFFPLNLILYVLPNIYSWDLLILLRILLAGMFTFWFMRSLAFRELPSLVAAIAFMLSGPSVLIQFWTMNVDILLPIVLIACDRLARKADIRNLCFLAVAAFITIIAGHPEHILLVNGVGLFFFLYRVFCEYLAHPQKPGYLKRLLFYPGAYLLSMGLAAFVLFPFLQNFIFEFWHAHPEGTGVLMEEQAGRAITIALPHFFQAVPLTFQWEFAGWYGGYLGTLVLGLAFLSLFRIQKRGLNYFFAVMAILVLSKEYSLPFINWIGYLPVMKMIRFAYHTPFIAAFCMAVLAGMGTRAVMLDKKLFLKGLIFSGGLLACIGLNLAHQISTDRGQLAIKASAFALGLLVLYQILLWLKDRRFLKPAVVGIFLAALTFAELFLYIHREHPRRFDSFPKVPYMEALKSSPERIRSYGNFWAFYPSTASAFEVDDLGYFFGLVSKRFVNFTNNLLIRNYFKNNLRPPAVRAMPIQNREHILDLLNIRYLILPADDTFARQFPHFEDPGRRFPLRYHQEVKIFERPGAFPRVFIVHRALFEPREHLALALIDKIGSQLKEVVVLESPPLPRVVEFLKTTPVEDASHARIVKYTPNEVIVDAQMQNAGILVLADTYHPDWRLTVNGKPWGILAADYLLRGVFLPKGIYQLRFFFLPSSFVSGLWVSFVSLLVLIGFWQFALRGKR